MITRELLSIVTGVNQVVGCFVGNHRGELRAHHMPDSYRLSDLVLALDQAVLLLEHQGADGAPSEYGVINCGDFHLRVQRFSHGYLCVLTSASVDVEQLSEKIRIVAGFLRLDNVDATTVRPPALTQYGDEDPTTIPLFG